MYLEGKVAAVTAARHRYRPAIAVRFAKEGALRTRASAYGVKAETWW